MRLAGLPVIVLVVIFGAILLVFALFGDTYHRSIAISALGGSIFFIVGCLCLVAVSVFLRRAPIFVRVIAVALTAGFLLLGGFLTAASTADLLGAPGKARGTITAHQIVAQRDTGQRGYTVSYTYQVTVNGQQWSIGSDGYNRFGVGHCIVVTFGPHTHMVTGVDACSRGFK